MKPIMITLLYLTSFGEIKLDTFEIFISCHSWYSFNVKIHERKQRKMFSNLYYHEYKGKQVVGYVCGGNEPR